MANFSCESANIKHRHSFISWNASARDSPNFTLLLDSSAPPELNDVLYRVSWLARSTRKLKILLLYFASWSQNYYYCWWGICCPVDWCRIERLNALCSIDRNILAYTLRGTVPTNAFLHSPWMNEGTCQSAFTTDHWITIYHNIETVKWCPRVAKWPSKRSRSNIKPRNREA